MHLSITVVVKSCFSSYENTLGYNSCMNDLLVVRYGLGMSFTLSLFLFVVWVCTRWPRVGPFVISISGIVEFYLLVWVFRLYER